MELWDVDTNGNEAGEVRFFNQVHSHVTSAEWGGESDLMALEELE